MSFSRILAVLAVDRQFAATVVLWDLPSTVDSVHLTVVVGTGPLGTGFMDIPAIIGVGHYVAGIRIVCHGSIVAPAATISNNKNLSDFGPQPE